MKRWWQNHKEGIGPLFKIQVKNGYGELENRPLIVTSACILTTIRHALCSNYWTVSFCFLIPPIQLLLTSLPCVCSINLYHFCYWGCCLKYQISMSLHVCQRKTELVRSSEFCRSLDANNSLLMWYFFQFSPSLVFWGLEYFAKIVLICLII